MSITADLSRRGTAPARVTNIELFFDLVYVFAITQLSHRLVEQVTLGVVLETALLLAMVWTLWVYTTWVTNWLDPDRLPVRAMLIVLAAMSLVLAAGIPDAFGARGLWVGVTYAVMQVGRSAFAVAGLQGSHLQRNFQRILTWCLVSGALAVAGGFVHGAGRPALWAAAVAVDVLGGFVGFATPGLGRSTTTDWTIAPGHIAERCGAFVLIAIGESVVAIGATFSELPHVAAIDVAAFVGALVGAAALWWIYFDRTAESAAEALAASDDPGRLGHLAYHLVHPLMVGGIIATAAADDLVLAHPAATAGAPTVWLVLGGCGLFLAGYAVFKFLVWGVVPASVLAGIVLLAVLGVLGVAIGSLSGLALGSLTALILVGTAAAQRALTPATATG